MAQDLDLIFKKLRALLATYSPPLKPKHNTKRYYDLWSFKDLVVADRKRKEVYFAGIIIQKDYVGFYYMPIYTDTDLKDVFGPELLATLKGKSCFHIKKLDAKLERQIKKALIVGYALYKKRGWV